MNKIPYVLAVALLCGCSSDWSAGLAEGGAPAGSSSLPPGVTGVGMLAEGMAAQGRPDRPAFAAAPDRGSLAAYPAQPVVRQTGAYTWHAAQLSEEHALRAMTTGELQFDTPDGRRLTLEYVRHVEHPDGNWSWIGKVPGETVESSVITFGQDAAFGTIPQGSDLPPLRLTVADGRSWVVSADPEQLSRMESAGSMPDAVDFVVPPKLTGGTSGSGSMAMAGASVAKAGASGKTVIDVLVGYTVGFASNLGGTSAALTRVRNLVEITNQAYANSQINAEVRLVHSMPVNYADATDNGDALEELTGFRAPSTRTTPAAAFSQLRQARETYGADLVVLLRRFQNPENDSCGIAWLIGGGKSGIVPNDSYFGYSVVSDGADQGTDGKSYFCREETFAHELGHNMGSQHDLANAKSDDGEVSYGAYDYSFGQKTDASSGNFYSIMAYGDSGQTRVRVFSNPSVTICEGRACGTGSADNARSLRQTAPLVAAFRTSVVAEAPSSTRRGDDANADGRSDLFWHSVGQQGAQNWYMNGPSFSYSRVNRISSDYRSAGVGDFNGDARADIIWYDVARTSVWLWQARIDGTYDVRYLRPYPTGWEIAGIGDFNGDARADLFWHSKSAQATQAWLMNGSTWTYGRVNPIASKYDVAAVGDTNGDGRADVVWQDDARTQVWLWQGRLTGGAFDVAYVRSFPTGWHVDALGDSNGDGRDDIFWHNNAQGIAQSWLMNGSAVSYGQAKSVGSQYQVAGSGDFNGDGRLDIVWRDSARTELWEWQGRADGRYNVYYLRDYPTGWELLNY